MTYYSGIPGSSDVPSTSQGQMQTNFNTLSSQFGNDHFTFGSGTNAGFHKQITFAANESPSTPTESTSYLYTTVVSAVSQLSYLNSSGTAAQLTNLVASAITGTTSDGGTYIKFSTPWGFNVWCGTTASGSGTRVLTLSGSVTFGTTIYTAVCSPFGAAAMGSAITAQTTVTTSQLSIGTANAAAVKWLVISV